MKQLIQYNSKCLNAMYDYLQGGELSKLIDTLYEVQDHAISKMDGDRYGEDLWFKFSVDDTLATSIMDLATQLGSGSKHNREFYRDCMKQACKNNTLEVYFS